MQQPAGNNLHNTHSPTAGSISNILVAVCGGIAVYKSITLVRRLIDAGFNVRVLMTEGAQAFVTPLTFQAVSGNPVHTQLLDSSAEAAMGHIELAKWAHLIVIAPATANTIAHIAQGLAHRLLETVLLATTAPVWLYPSMNQAMWANAMVQHNCQLLISMGYKVHTPASGIQACGDQGLGRLPEPEDIATAIVNWQRAQQSLGLLAGKRVLITAGPTQEAIDPVRYLSNYSTGKMGYALAEACLLAGAKVTLVSGPVQLPALVGVRIIKVVSAAAMQQAVLAELNDQVDVFVATAAVADYRPAEPSPNKIKKHADIMNIALHKNPDILASVASHTLRPAMVVGFAAETQDMETYAQDKLTRKKLDMIVANDVSRSDIGFAADDNAVSVWLANGDKIVVNKAPKWAIAQALVVLIADKLKAGKA